MSGGTHITGDMHWYAYGEAKNMHNGCYGNQFHPKCLQVTKTHINQKRNILKSNLKLNGSEVKWSKSKIWFFPVYVILGKLNI